MASLRVLVVLQLFALCYGMEIPRGETMGKDVEKDRRIMGGEDTTITAFPFVISLEVKGMFMCGGSIISEKFIITAAHCLITRIEDYKVRVGSSYIEKEGILHKVKRAVRHPKYRKFDYDVAVIELEEPIKFNENASAIAVSDEDPVPGDITTVIGFGMMNDAGDLADILQTANVTVISNDKCRVYFPFVTDRIFCTFEEGKAPYRGDSGSPITLNGKIVGNVSFGGRDWRLYPTGYPKYAHPEIREFIDRETGV